MNVSNPVQTKVAVVVPNAPKVSNLLVSRVVDSTFIKLAYNVSVCGVPGLGGLAKGAGTSLASPDQLRAYTLPLLGNEVNYFFQHRTPGMTTYTVL